MQAKADGPVIYYRDPNAKAASAAQVAEAPADAKKIKFYRNPMGLPDTSPVPKKDGMGMDYIPVYEGEDSDDGSVKVSPGKIQRTGVQTVTVGRHAITRTIRAPGVVALDERRVAVVAPKFDGYVVKVGDVTTGTHVKQGDVLATVFGQAVLDQAARLLIEQNSGWTRGDDTSAAAGEVGPSGVVGASRRLQNLGVTQEFIDQVKHERRVPDTFTIRAPISGDVLERNWSDGQGFKAGDVGFRIADHSLVWMMANVAEGDIDALKVWTEGQGHDPRPPRPHLHRRGDGDLSAPDEGNAHRAGPHRTAQPRHGAAAGHVWRRRDHDRRQRQHGGRSGQRRHRQRQPPGGPSRPRQRSLRTARDQTRPQGRSDSSKS